MNRDLTAQIHDYFGLVDARQSPLTLDEVLGRGTVVRPASGPARPVVNRPVLVAAVVLVAAAVAAAVLLIARPFGSTGVADGTPDLPGIVPGLPGEVVDGWCEPTGSEDVARGPDGSLWDVHDPYEPGVRLRRTLPDGETILYPLPPGAFDLGAPDFEGRVGGGTTTVVPVPESALTTGADLGPYYDLEVSADGLVWISGDGYFGALWRFDPDAWIWERVDLGTGQGTLAGEVLALPLSAGGIEATCDGSLWVLRAVFHLGGTEDWSLAGIGPDGSMAEFEPDLPAGDLPDAAALGLSGTDAARVRIEPGAPCGIVADNRAVWLFDGEHWGSIYEPQVFGGVVRFDGTTWTRFLDGEVVWDLSLADDGSAEASSHRDSGRTITLEP